MHSNEKITEGDVELQVSSSIASDETKQSQPVHNPLNPATLAIGSYCKINVTQSSSPGIKDWQLTNELRFNGYLCKLISAQLLLHFTDIQEANTTISTKTSHKSSGYTVELVPSNGSKIPKNKRCNIRSQHLKLYNPKNPLQRPWLPLLYHYLFPDINRTNPGDNPYSCCLLKNEFYYDFLLDLIVLLRCISFIEGCIPGLLIVWLLTAICSIVYRIFLRQYIGDADSKDNCGTCKVLLYLIKITFIAGFHFVLIYNTWMGIEGWIYVILRIIATVVVDFNISVISVKTPHRKKRKIEERTGKYVDRRDALCKDISGQSICRFLIFLVFHGVVFQYVVGGGIGVALMTCSNLHSAN